jgi:thiamine kinase-like enzyme
MPTDPNEVIARIGAWASARSVTVEEQKGGKTNVNYRVTVDGEQFVLRISGPNTAPLGIDRARERDATLAAARIGVAPEVVAFLFPEGHLVTRFIAGREWSPDDLKRPDVIPRAADVLRRVHALPPIAGRFDPYRDTAERLALIREHGIALPASLPQMLERAEAIRNAREAALDGALALCHNDPWHNNFLDDGTRVRLLDWEFAGMGDPFFDLASVTAVYSPEQKADFLRHYQGGATAASLEALEQMVFVVILWNATWALVQIALEQTADDYATMARGMFNFLEARL